MKKCLPALLKSDTFTPFPGSFSLCSASVSTSRPVLHLLCGKIAAGKSTLAHLFAGEMHDVADYVRCAGKLRNAMTPHLILLLQCGVSVVLDRPANDAQFEVISSYFVAPHADEGFNMVFHS